MACQCRTYFLCHSDLGQGQQVYVVHRRKAVQPPGTYLSELNLYIMQILEKAPHLGLKYCTVTPLLFHSQKRDSHRFGGLN